MAMWMYRLEFKIIEQLQDARDVNEFDDALDELYNWADENRVWLGGI